ncbi:protein-disulfide reductase DsbD [Sphaerotilus mobilis]|uniref:Thiol:disulfide interchange protein DsbD n=1 Tax=Sphaerotilus mobilis TaxID=47994 RepID=A0A4Q7LSH2_9BURK|nr:protein-disulfide reductase DsbD [Sphaerotilus mobilis]RZS56579.1 thiol:disulfide interchange protein DsbD [Sphaerotilus mobilis]
MSSKSLSVSLRRPSAHRWTSLVRLVGGLFTAFVLLCAVAPLRAAEFLEPDQAFKLSARSPDGAQIEVRYEIVDDYYMYRERLAVVAAPDGVQLGAPVIPPGKVKFDETFQKDVETYRRELVYRVPVTSAPAEFKLTVTSQGCADAGLCYPPREQVLKVKTDGGAIRSVEVLGDEAGAAWTPVAATAQAITAVAAVQPAPAAGSDDAVSRALRSGSLWSVVAVFALAGLLLSFTPCVLPMVPILSSIIVGQGAATSRSRGLMLSISYALGLALVYTLFGVLAGLAGEGLAATLQTPAVLGAFAALLVILSLSMFGAYELQMPASLQTRLTAWSGNLGGGGHHLGVFVMGGISALIVGPCVAAPLAGALLYISQTRDVLIGAVALFALACGMSVPLLLVGASAGSLLPRAGAWMDGVKRFFGITMLAVAIWMLTPVIPTWVAMAAWGLLLIVSAVLLGLLDRLSDSASMLARSAKGLALVLALVGAAQWIGLLSGGRSVLQPLGHLAGGAGPASAAGASGVTAKVPHDAGLAAYRRVKTSAELDQILKTAGQPVMLDFYADWCVSCKEFEQFTFPDPQVQAKLAGALLLQADVTANDAADRELLKRFSLFGPPGILFFDAQGQERSAARVIGYQNVPQFLQSLTSAGL